MNQLYLIEPTKQQFDEWKSLEFEVRKFAGICQNRTIVTEKDLTDHNDSIMRFMDTLDKLNKRTMSLFKPVTLEEAKAANVAGGSSEVVKILGIEVEKLPF